MDRNAKRRKRYAEMPPERKKELLRCQRAASACRYAQMPQEKKDDLLRRRREANASKKKNIPPSVSDSVPNSGISNRKRPASTPQTPLAPAGTVLSIPVTSVHSASNQSTDLLSSDALAGGTPYSLGVQSENVLPGVELTHLLSSTVAPLESDQHASSSVAASSIPSGFRQGST